MSKSKALVVSKVNELEFVELEKPTVRDYEVLIKTYACSLCTIDRRVYSGARSKKLPFLGGHEFSGIVMEVGKGVIDLKPGDRVITTSAYCNQCVLDRTNRGTQCLNKAKELQRVEFSGTILGGGLNEYNAIPAWQVIKVDEDVNLTYAALTEPLSCCVHSVTRAEIKFGETVVIIGYGIMGYFQLKLALMQGARVIVSETNDERRARALKDGAHKVIDPLNQDLKADIFACTDDLGADVVINTIPSTKVWTQAIELLAPNGRLIAYSSQDGKELTGIDFGYLHSKEIKFIGTAGSTIEDNERALKLISYGLINMSEVIESIYSFEQGIEAFNAAMAPGAYRVIIKYE